MSLNPPPGQHKRWDQISYFIAQRQAFYEFLYTGTFTASQAVRAIEVPHKSITRYKRQLQKAGKLWEIRKVICPVTGHPAMLITTNPVLVPGLLAQGSLFQKEVANG